LQRGVLRAAFLLPQRFAPGLEELGGVAVFEQLAVFGDAVGRGFRLREDAGRDGEREGRGAHAQGGGGDGGGGHHDTTASSLRVSPLLSFQLIVILSPALAPFTLNCRNGFFATDVPHSAVSTVLPFSWALTSWMYQAG